MAKKPSHSFWKQAMAWWKRYKARWRRHDWTTSKDLAVGQIRLETWPAWARRCLFDVTLEINFLGFVIICQPFAWYLSWRQGILKLGPFYIYAE
jgi:hypothetical protein